MSRDKETKKEKLNLYGVHKSRKLTFPVVFPAALNTIYIPVMVEIRVVDPSSLRRLWSLWDDEKGGFKVGAKFYFRERCINHCLYSFVELGDILENIFSIR